MQTQQETIAVSIVVPAYNEEANLSSTLHDMAQYLNTQDYTYEVIVVDDGSTDKTSEIAHALAPLFSRCKILKNETNRGKGYAVKKGSLSSQEELMLFMDADNATRICHLKEFIEAARQGYDLVIGSRRLKDSKVIRRQPFLRRVLGTAYILLSGLILGIKVKDYNCGFKLFRRDAARQLFSQLTRHDWSFDSELIYLAKKARFKIKEVPVTWEDRKTTSKVRPFRDSINSFQSLLAIRFASRKP